jgi:hypothetical protein
MPEATAADPREVLNEEMKRRYRNDAQFHYLVECFVHTVTEGGIAPADLQSAMYTALELLLPERRARLRAESPVVVLRLLFKALAAMFPTEGRARHTLSLDNEGRLVLGLQDGSSRHTLSLQHGDLYKPAEELVGEVVAEVARLRRVGGRLEWRS